MVAVITMEMTGVDRARRGIWALTSRRGLEIMIRPVETGS
jgi:hypothetical protein